MADDISQKSIVVLVILTLVVSVIGSWAVMDALSSRPVAYHPSSTGKVMLKVVPPKQPVIDSESGIVSLTVNPQPGGE